MSTKKQPFKSPTLGLTGFLCLPNAGNCLLTGTRVIFGTVASYFSRFCAGITHSTISKTSKTTTTTIILSVSLSPAPLMFAIAREWKEISVLAKDLIDNLLEEDYMERYSALDALKHPWIEQHTVAPDSEVTPKDD